MQSDELAARGVRVKELPPQEKLLCLLRYEPETGKLFWRERKIDTFPDLRSCAAWNARYAGREALTYVTWNGYASGAINNRRFMAHRVIWAMMTGAWPTADIDHINGNRTDNRWQNLRAASRSENNCNQRVSGKSISGVKGVTWDKSRQKWLCRIKVHRKSVRIGSFEDIQDAIREASRARSNLHGQFARDK